MCYNNVILNKTLTQKGINIMKHLLFASFLVSIIGLAIGNNNGFFTFIFCWSGGFLIPIIIQKINSSIGMVILTT